MIKRKHDQRWWQNAIIEFIIVITEIVHAVTSRDFRRCGQRGANLLPSFKVIFCLTETQFIVYIQGK